MLHARIEILETVGGMSVLVNVDEYDDAGRRHVASARAMVPPVYTEEPWHRIVVAGLDRAESLVRHSAYSPE